MKSRYKFHVSWLFVLFLIIMLNSENTIANETETEIPAIPAGVKLVTLDNGLTIIIREDHSAPVVSAQAWCKSGSINEGEWLGAGLSHVLEHMLFKGTENRGPGVIDRQIQEAGGYINAYTSFDRTVYWINVPNTGATTAVDILCDIMKNATLPPEELKKEQQVILREMDMNQDDPGRRSSRRLFETAYTKSLYRYTVIGYPDVFNKLEPDDIMAYYKKHYVPNNIFFVIAGDVDASKVEAQIREAFESTPMQPLPPQSMHEEPQQMAQRLLIEEAPIEMAHFHFGWHVPDIRHPDTPALDVLSTLLGDGRSSRLFRGVRETGLAHAVSAWVYSPGNTGLFGISAVCDADKFEAARGAILAEVERVKRGELTDDELEKARKQLLADTWSSKKTMQGQAQDLGSNWMAARDLNFSMRYLDTVNKLTTADLARVAEEYLSRRNRTLYSLMPEGTSPTQVEESEVFSDLPIEKHTLSNGMTLLFKEDKRLPFVEFRMVFKGGVLAESVTNNGVTQLMSKMLVKGTETRSAEQIAGEIESVGGSIDTYSGNNSFGVNAEVMKTDLDLGLELLADVALNPAWPSNEFELERGMQLAAIKAQKDQVLVSAIKQARRAIYGDSSYGLDALGTEESVAALDINDAKTQYKRLALPNNCVLAVYGNIDVADVKSKIERAFGKWEQGAHVLKELPKRPVIEEPRTVVETVDKKQAVVVVGFPGVAVDDKDRFALDLIQESCSDIGSRVFTRIREDLGLAYFVGARNMLGLAPGYFAFYAGTMPEKAERVKEEFFKEVEQLRSEGISESELERAKAKLIGQKKIGRQDLGMLAMATALDELYGLGYKNIDSEDALYEEVSVEDIKQAAVEYLNPEACVTAIVKDASEAEPGESRSVEF